MRYMEFQGVSKVFPDCSKIVRVFQERYWGFHGLRRLLRVPRRFSGLFLGIPCGFSWGFSVVEGVPRRLHECSWEFQERSMILQGV